MKERIVVVKVLFTSSTCSSKTYEDIFFQRKNRIIDPMQKFLLQIMNGLAEGGNRVVSISIRPYSYSTYNERRIKKSKESDNNITYIYPGFSNGRLSRFITTYFAVLYYTLKTIIREKDIAVITDPLDPFICKPTRVATRLMGKKCIAIVTDLPLEATKMKEKKTSWIKEKLTRAYEWFSNLGIKRFDGYVLLTEQMNEIVNTKGRPYCVIEGSIDSGRIEDINKKRKEEHEGIILMYAGGVYEKYGLKNLVEAFISANMTNVELHIYGEGSYVDELIQVTKAHQKIKYKGCVLNDKLEGIERNADLLINPRFSDSGYTKYSFPSKTLEYMSSGTATLSTRLSGIPVDYNDYLLWFDDESVTGMKITLQNAVKMGKMKLEEIGLRAQQYVVSEKNSIVQGRKIVNLISMIR